MRCPKCRHAIDPAKIPDEVLKAERARRNSLKRITLSGGTTWKNHYEDRPNCKCEKCNLARALREHL